MRDYLGESKSKQAVSDWEDLSCSFLNQESNSGPTSIRGTPHVTNMSRYADDLFNVSRKIALNCLYNQLSRSDTENSRTEITE